MWRHWWRRRSRSTKAAAAALAVGAALLVAPATPAGIRDACTGRAGHPHTYAHVVVIVMENHSIGQVVGAPGARYITRAANLCGLATRYHAITHPSLPNYLALTSGSTAGITTDCNACRSGGPNIFRQVARAGMRWRAFAESMPGRCARYDAGRYLMRHNPAVYYTRLRATCRAADLPMGTPAAGRLARALRRNTLPAYMFLTPDACHDMHDCPVSSGDAWLHAWLPRILATRSYRAGHTVVFLTFDEGSGSNHVATLVISPFVAPGTRAAHRYTHYSLLRTAESLLGLRHLGQARAAAGMRRGFGI